MPNPPIFIGREMIVASSWSVGRGRPRCQRPHPTNADNILFYTTADFYHSNLEYIVAHRRTISCRPARSNTMDHDPRTFSCRSARSNTMDYVSPFAEVL
jgi:hypothetical protein